MDEMVKLGGKSPKRPRDAGRFGPNMQLNTIEEDLYETQTSHYSQVIREGEATIRDEGLLSSSNQLRSSN
jgi:hypothetical protein